MRREKGDLSNATGSALILSHVEQILGTRCDDGSLDGPGGELPWNPAFGSLLYKLRHQNLKEVLRYQARAYCIDALARWEPRVRVVAVNILTDREKRKLSIRTTVEIINSNSRGVGREQHTVETDILKAVA